MTKYEQVAAIIALFDYWSTVVLEWGKNDTDDVLLCAALDVVVIILREGRP